MSKPVITYDMLNDQQQPAVDAITEFFQDRDEQCLVLEAPAGAGKSTMVDVLEKRASGLKLKKLASTNAAASLLGSDSQTLASFLKLKPSFAGRKKTFYQWGTPEIEDIDGLVVDEASMVGLAEKEHLLALDLPILWMGEKIQLPPIETDPVTNKPVLYSSVFTDGFRTIEIDKIERYSGTIFDHVVYMRNQIKAGQYSSILQPGWDKIDPEVLRRQDDRDFKQFIKSDEGLESFFSGDAGIASFAWSRVDYFNNLMRRQRHGQDYMRYPFILDDQVMLKDTCCIPDPDSEDGLDTKVFLRSNDQGSVIGVEQMNNPYTTIVVDSWKVLIDTATGPRKVYVPTNTGKDQLSRWKTSQANAAKAEKHKATKNALWKEYHFNTSVCADLTYSMARTVHRFQGQTIKEMFTDYKGIMGRTGSINARAEYVAGTRAAEVLTHVM